MDIEQTYALLFRQALAGLPEALRVEELASYDAVKPASASDHLTKMHNQAGMVFAGASSRTEISALCDFQ